MTDLKKAEYSLPEQWALSAKDHFLKIASEKTWLKEISFAMQIIKNSPDGVQKCNNESIKDAIVNIALTGATLNPAMKQAYLVPRSIQGKGLCCCLDFSYIGLVKIATDSGSVLDIDATCVYEGDKFYYEMGLEPVLKHTPSTERDAKKITHVYAVAVLKDGLKKFLVITKEEIDKARATSKAKNSPAWRDWYGEMARKTVVKRFYKLLPQTERLSQVIDVINEHEGLADKIDKGGDIAKRFEKTKNITPGKTEELPEEKTLLDRLDAIETSEELEKFWPEFEAELDKVPEEKDALIEAFDYKRSELKEKS